jgi:hypothetical protein
MPMLPEYKKKTNIGIGLGLVLQIAGRILLMSGGALGAIPGLVLVLGGLVAFIWGCWSYAEGKGYSGLCGLLGLFSLIGLLILAALPDRHKEAY